MLQRLIGAVWLAVLLSAPALAQEDAEEAQPTRDTPFVLTLGKVIGLPGQVASLPVLFSRKSGAPNVAALRFRFSYPGSAIQFSKIEDAYLSRRVGMQVEAKEESTAGDRVLEVSIKLPDPKKEFPSGQIATIFFNVLAGVGDQTIPLNPPTWIDDNEVKPDSSSASIEPGEIRISQTPVYVSCFFFTH
jgi:hypothetical protein